MVFFCVIVIHGFAACLMFLLSPVTTQDNFKSPELAEGKAAAPALIPAFQTVKPVCLGRKNQGVAIGCDCSLVKDSVQDNA